MWQAQAVGFHLLEASVWKVPATLKQQAHDLQIAAPMHGATLEPRHKVSSALAITALRPRPGWYAAG
jgi:hypothetical protein